MVTRAHWEGVYTTKKPTEVSWYQPSADTSLALVDAANVPKDAAIVDVGAGASTFVDGLVARGYADVTLLDVAAPALETTRARLGDVSARIETVVSDVTAWRPSRRYGLWHDRAVFHFLVEDEARVAYRRVLREAVAPGGVVIVATFAEDGPEKCSGLPVRRYSAEALAAELGEGLVLLETRRERHVTPWHSEQSFVYVAMRRAS